MISVKNLSKHFGDNKAVDDLSFQIQSGETFGLLGPNGAGKTTTISMIVGLLKPDYGDVEIDSDTEGHQGSPLNHLVRRRIGIAPQSLSLYEDLTARENLSFFGSLYNLSGSELKDRCNWCLEFSGLEDRQKDRVGTFSGGMKRRLNIAAAMMHEPKILLLDEPTVGVDPQSRNHIFDSIESLRFDGLTIIYTTHYMEEAARLCNRVAIVDHGKLLALDSVDALISKHGGDSVVTAGFNRSFKMNQLPAELQKVEAIQNAETAGENQIRFTSGNPLESIAKLASSGIELETLNISRPDLERVFLNLTGRNLRD